MLAHATLALMVWVPALALAGSQTQSDLWNKLPNPASYLLRNTIDSRNFKDDDAVCPQEPMPDRVWHLIADGECRHTNYDKTVGFAYKLMCNQDGGVTADYYEVSNTSITSSCDKAIPGLPTTLAGGACFDINTMSAKIVCSSPHNNATLFGWSSPKPEFNQIEGKQTTRDLETLVSKTVFPDYISLPPNGKQKVANIYVQTPYDIAGDFTALLKAIPSGIDSLVYGATGFHFPAAITIQQCRGLYNSSGEFDLGGNTQNDSGDTGKWAEEQEWFNGVTLTQGASAMGMTAIISMGSDPRLVTRGSWVFITTNDLREAFYRGGALIIGVMGSILAPGFIPSNQFPRALVAAHEGDGPDPYWNARKFDDFKKVSWPVVIRTSWFDMFQKGGLFTAEKLKKESDCGGYGCSVTLFVDALGHSGLEGIPKYKGAFPYNETAQNLITGYEATVGALLMITFSRATSDVIATGLNVFWAALTKLIPQKVVYVLGSGGNYMTSFEEWPTKTYQKLYLGAEGTLSSTIVPYTGSAFYKYDPSNPAPTYGGWIFQSQNPLGEGCVDQSPLSSRKDVIHFNNQALKEEYAICGEITATLTVGSSANDTDFIIRLVDQYPSGERYPVAEGIVRMRFRKKQLTPDPMIPGEQYTVEIDMWSACWVFAVGHQIGIDITSSSEFMYLPNPNTGLPLEGDQIWPQGGEHYRGRNITATNYVFYGSSEITLPTVSKTDLPMIGPLILPSPPMPPSDEELHRMGTEALAVRAEAEKVQAKEAKLKAMKEVE